jgi:hypothetical protein
MVLYHQTPKDRVAKIRREGLKPHVPGKVWGICDPAMTGGKPVVWLTADQHTFHHAKHPDKKMRKPDAVLLTIHSTGKSQSFDTICPGSIRAKNRTGCDIKIILRLGSSISARSRPHKLSGDDEGPTKISTLFSRPIPCVDRDCTRFPPPWSGACFIVKDVAGQKLAFIYFEEEPGWLSLSFRRQFAQ